MVEIRKYSKSDYANVRKNLEAGDMFDPVWDSEVNLGKMIAIDPESVLVAVEDGQTIGNIYILAGGWEAYIFRLAVRPSHRNKGIGKQLMQEAEKKLK